MRTLDQRLDRVMLIIGLKESCFILPLEPLIQGMKCASFSNNTCRQHFFKLTCVIGFFMPNKLGFYFSSKKQWQNRRDLNLLRF